MEGWISSFSLGQYGFVTITIETPQLLQIKTRYIMLLSLFKFDLDISSFDFCMLGVALLVQCRGCGKGQVRNETEGPIQICFIGKSRQKSRFLESA